MIDHCTSWCIHWRANIRFPVKKWWIWSIGFHGCVVRRWYFLNSSTLCIQFTAVGRRKSLTIGIPRKIIPLQVTPWDRRLKRFTIKRSNKSMILTLLCWSPDIDFCHSENSESESLWSELWVEETKRGGKNFKMKGGNSTFELNLSIKKGKNGDF